MTYKEAEEAALNIKWRIGTCGEGTKCWCRTILPVEEVTFTEEGIGESVPYMVMGPAEMSAKVAERIVNDHNRLLEFWND